MKPKKYACIFPLQTSTYGPGASAVFPPFLHRPFPKRPLNPFAVFGRFWQNQRRAGKWHGFSTAIAAAKMLYSHYVKSVSMSTDFFTSYALEGRQLMEELAAENRQYMKALIDDPLVKSRNDCREIKPFPPSKRFSARQAKDLVQKAVATGTLLKGPCIACGELDGVQAHHESYNHPLDVIWMCPRHHTQYHKHLHSMGIWIF